MNLKTECFFTHDPISCNDCYMTRPARTEIKNGVFLVSAYSVEKSPAFTCTQDMEMFLHIISSVTETSGWKCHGYCLLKDHYHLIIETPKTNLSKGMRQINGLYTQYFNRTYTTAGSLFRGRFKSVILDKNQYLLPIARHIVLNPVRLGYAASTAEYRWSSYNETCGNSNVSSFLYPDWILEQLGSKRKKAQKKYKKYIQDGINTISPLLAVRQQVFLGSDEFIEKIKKKTRRKTEKKLNKLHAKQLSRPSLNDIFFNTLSDKKKRNRAIQKAHGKFGYSLKEIGQFLKLHYTTISKILNNRSTAQ